MWPMVYPVNTPNTNNEGLSEKIVTMVCMLLQSVSTTSQCTALYPCRALRPYEIQQHRKRVPLAVIGGPVTYPACDNK